MERPRPLWIIFGVLSGAFMALAVYLLTAPNPDPTPSFPMKDKIQHFLMFGGLAGPALLVLPKRYWWFWLAHMLALAAGSEIVQAAENFGRKGSVFDFVADAAGIACAGLVAVRLRKWLSPEAEPPAPQSR
jgi:hypothetical protein